MNKKYALLIIVLSMALVIPTGFSYASESNSENIDCGCEKVFFKADDCLIYATMDDIPPRPRFDSVSDKIEIKKTGPLEDIPDYFNWADYNGGDWTTPARYQGSCGSCWAFSAIGMIESQYNIANGNPNLNLDLSEQYILSCLKSAGSCNGGWVDAALNCILREDYPGNYVNGVVTENCFNYYGNDYISCNMKCSDWLDDLWEIENHGSYIYNVENPNPLKEDLINYGPMGIYFYASSNFKIWGNYHHSPDDYYPYDENELYPHNHAVLLVGYKDDEDIPNGGYWICKNSWGTSFGYNGFFNIEYQALGICDEACWVSVPAIDEFEVDFNYYPEQPTNQDVIQFEDNSSSVGAYWWDFEDGYYSDLENPKHCFYDEGSYDVTLTVENLDGTVESITKTVVVTLEDSDPDNDNPLADFNYIINDLNVSFYDNSIDVDGYIVSWFWDFYDSTSSSEQNPIHQYSQPGVYSVSLTITDNLGGSDVKTKNIDLSSAPEEELDQEQNQVSNDFIIYAYRKGAQSFIPSLGTLTKVELFVGKNGEPSTPLTVSIRNSIEGEDLAVVSKPGSEISNTPGWVEFDFDDLSVNPGSTYFIITKSGGYSYSNCYHWWYFYMDTYNNGCYWHSLNYQPNWNMYLTRDFGFKTYGL